MNRTALIRIGVLLAVLVVLMVVAGLMMIRMPLQSYAGPWVPLDARETAVRDALKADVQRLAGDIGERNVFRPARYAAAAEFIERELTNAGYRVARQTFLAQREPCSNLEAELVGVCFPREFVVIGAHYDSVSGCPGANDNASAVAALLGLARALVGARPGRTLRFVAFANEEPPFFQNEGMGSLVYAQGCRSRNEDVVAMLSLETMGCYRDEPGSQNYPFPIGLAYPSTGNFIGFVGNTRSARLVRTCVESFRRQVKFPSEGGALPAGLPGVGWSDHWAFWQANYPGVMVTDTAPFRYPFYHTADDTPDKLDYDRLARVVSGLERVIRELADVTGPAR